MKILLTTVGSAGDVHPFVAIGLALAERGCEVALAANPHFEPLVRSAGLGYEPLGEALDPVSIARTNPAAFSRYRGPAALFRGVFAPRFRELYDATLAALRAREPDLVVGHQISFGLPMAARKAGVPWAVATLAPATVISDRDPNVYAIGPDVRGWPMPARRAVHAMARFTINRLVDPPMNKLRRSVGEPTRRGTLFEEMLGADLVLGMWSPAFRGPAADDPAGLEIVGFPWFDRREPGGLEPVLEAFLEAGEPPVVVSLGSVLSATHDRLFERAAEACERLGVRAVFVTGRAATGRGPAAGSVLRVGYAPYGLLFPRAGVTVHHGGIGTTAQALRAGVPTLVLPHAHDQFDNAARVEGLGVGGRLSRAVPTVGALASAIDRLLGDAVVRERSSALGARLRAEDGASRAAERIIARVRREETV